MKTGRMRPGLKNPLTAGHDFAKRGTRLRTSCADTGPEPSSEVKWGRGGGGRWRLGECRFEKSMKRSRTRLWEDTRKLREKRNSTAGGDEGKSE